MACGPRALASWLGLRRELLPPVGVAVRVHGMLRLDRGHAHLSAEEDAWYLRMLEDMAHRKGNVGICVDTAPGLPRCCPGELTWCCELKAGVCNDRAPLAFVLSPFVLQQVHGFLLCSVVMHRYLVMSSHCPDVAGGGPSAWPFCLCPLTRPDRPLSTDNFVAQLML